MIKQLYGSYRIDKNSLIKISVWKSIIKKSKQNNRITDLNILKELERVLAKNL